MKNSKRDELVINISTKDKIYLFIIIGILLIAALAGIYTYRYFELKNRKMDKFANGNGIDNSQGNNSGSTIKPEPENEIYINGELLTYDKLKDNYSTRVINTVYGLDYAYHTFGDFLDSRKVLNISILNVTEELYLVLESYAKTICDKLDEYTKSGYTISESLIQSDDLLVTYIGYFKNTLNNMQK